MAMASFLKPGCKRGKMKVKPVKLRILPSVCLTIKNTLTTLGGQCYKYWKVKKTPRCICENNGRICAFHTFLVDAKLGRTALIQSHGQLYLPDPTEVKIQYLPNT